MTSEEAIKYLKKMKDECNDKFHKVRYVTREEALDMAIKALEQEPKETWSIKDVATTFERHGLMTEQEPCEDCISRDSLKHKLQEHHDFFVNAYGGFSNLPQNDKSRVDEITNCIAMVVNEPPVTPKPKTGHWMKQDLGYRCSYCTLCTNEKGRLTYNYCPNCGAKMESEDKE